MFLRIPRSCACLCLTEKVAIYAIPIRMVVFESSHLKAIG